MCVCVLICEAITTYSLSCLCLSSKSWFLQCSIWQPFFSIYPPSLTTLTRCLYLFPIADVRTHHKPSGFKQHKCITHSPGGEKAWSQSAGSSVPAGGPRKACVPGIASTGPRLLAAPSPCSGPAVQHLHISLPMTSASCSHLLLRLSWFHCPCKDVSDYILHLHNLPMFRSTNSSHLQSPLCRMK